MFQSSIAFLAQAHHLLAAAYLFFLFFISSIIIPGHIPGPLVLLCRTSAKGPLASSATALTATLHRYTRAQASLIKGRARPGFSRNAALLSPLFPPFAPSLDCPGKHLPKPNPPRSTFLTVPVGHPPSWISAAAIRSFSILFLFLGTFERSLPPAHHSSDREAGLFWYRQRALALLPSTTPATTYIIASPTANLNDKDAPRKLCLFL